MSKPFTDILSHPLIVRLLPLAKKVAVTGFAQALIQGIGFISGILIIRLLPTEEYALYTLANTMLGTMTVLADGGISTGVMAQGGKVWQDKEKLGVVLATGLELRRKFAIGSLLVSVPILFYLLHHNGADWIKATLIVMALIPAFWAALSDSLLEIIPKLHQDIIPLQKNQIHVSIGRLLLSGLSLFLFPWTFVAILANGIPRIWGNIQLKDIASRYAKINVEFDYKVLTDIVQVVKRIMPGAIYFSFSGQIMIWILSFFGKPIIIAQIGVLGRISILLNILNVLISSILIPRYSRLPERRSVLLKYANYTVFYFIILLVSFNIIIFICQDKIISLLGSQYLSIGNGLILSFIGMSLSVISGIIYSLYTCRGWMIRPLIYIPINISAIILFSILMGLSSLNRILMVGVLTSLVQVIMNLLYFYIKILRLK